MTAPLDYSSDTFLSSILNLLDLSPGLSLPSFCMDLVEPEESRFLSLENDLLDNIVSFIPLKERFRITSRVCRKLNEACKRSLRGIAFLRDGLDVLDDNSISMMLNKYGSQISLLNFDLFRSSASKECPQWTWRQQVVRSVKFCPNLKALDILVCTRHRLRDADLQQIFKCCPGLEVLKIDAQYLSGHCFSLRSVPPGLKQLEMEMCYRLTVPNLAMICTKAPRLTVLHLSQCPALDDKALNFILTLQHLEELSLVSDGKTKNSGLSSTGLSRISDLRGLNTLNLEGFGALTDKVLMDLSHPTNPTSWTIQNLSLAFCKNISSKGIQTLAEMSNLENLNLDGIVARDISSGVDAIAAKRRLVRLLLAENAFVTGECLLNVVRSCHKLRLLDISNNDKVLTNGVPRQIVSSRIYLKYPSLIILTNNDDPWRNISITEDSNGVRLVQVVHLHRHFFSSNYFAHDCVISPDRPLQLPSGLFAAKIRRGNRYRILLEAIIPMENDSRPNSAENEENGPSTNVSPYQFDPALSVDDQNSYFMPLMSAIRPTNGQVLQPLANNSMSMPAGFPVWNPNGADAMQQFNDMNLGAYMQPNLFIEPGMALPGLHPPANVGLDEFLKVVTSGSGGAPRPPLNDVPVVPDKERYTRGSRSNRRSRPLKKAPDPPKPAAPVFNDSDFPPLS